MESPAIVQQFFSSPIRRHAHSYRSTVGWCRGVLEGRVVGFEPADRCNIIPYSYLIFSNRRWKCPSDIKHHFQPLPPPQLKIPEHASGVVSTVVRVFPLDEKRIQLSHVYFHSDLPLEDKCVSLELTRCTLNDNFFG